MKKAIFTLAAVLMLSVSSFAHDGGKKTNDIAKVSYSVKTQFESTFGYLENVDWTVTSDFQKAEFLMDDVKTVAYYNSIGEYIGFAQQVSYNTLPISSKKAIASAYTGYFVTETVRFQPESATPASLYRLAAGGANEEIAYFVTLQKDDKQVLIRVTPFSSFEVVKN